MSVQYQCIICGAFFSGWEEGLPGTENEGRHISNAVFCAACYSHERMQAGTYITAWNYRAKKAGREGTLTLREWIINLDFFDWQCAYCDGPYEEMDHFLPITHGGGTTADNCVPCCSSCNPRKGNRPTEQGGFPSEKIEKVRKFLKTRKYTR